MHADHWSLFMNHYQSQYFPIMMIYGVIIHSYESLWITIHDPSTRSSLRICRYSYESRLDNMCLKSPSWIKAIKGNDFPIKTMISLGFGRYHLPTSNILISLWDITRYDDLWLFICHSYESLLITIDHYSSHY